MNVIKIIRDYKVVHIVCALLFLCIPIMLFENNTEFKISNYLMHLVVLSAYMLIFYFNYGFFIDRMLFKHKYIFSFVVINLVIIVGLWLLLDYWRDLHFKPIVKTTLNNGEELLLEKLQNAKILPPPEKWRFMALRDLWLMVLTVGLSVAIRVTEYYYKLKEETSELMRVKSETELKQLKSQLNPHFLFNTLNNIYSLIAISQTRAQEAVHGLSKLMRYVLYESNNETVLLEDDLQFMRSYIDLMTLRLGKNVTVNINIPQAPYGVQIAPLLFISLVENAFKHGVCNGEPSLINIEILTKESVVECKIKNSNCPKNEQDRSGSGIGIENLKRRLDLLYTKRFMYQAYVEGEYYYTTLKIELQ